jgi:uncharacterized phiE125 gp8 family phage protein
MNTLPFIPPYAEPLHLEEAKLHLKVETTQTEDDALIRSLIASSRNYVEVGTGSNVLRRRAMVAASFDAVFDSFYNDAEYGACEFGEIKLPVTPVLAITSIRYVDVDGNTQTLATSVYTLSKARNSVVLAYGQSWPSVRYQPGAVTIRFVAGMAVPFTATPSTDVIAPLGHTFTVGDRVRALNSGGALPTPLKREEDYFIIAGPQLSLTSGGAPINLTTEGDGTHFLGFDLSGFETLRQAMKGTLAHWYVNRESVILTGAVPQVLPQFVESLIWSEHA